MHRGRVVACLTLLAVPFHVAAQPSLPGPFADAIEGATARPQPMAYDVTVEQQTGAFHYTMNPNMAGAARVTAISPAENKLDQRERIVIKGARSNDRDIWCASRYLSRATNVQLVREDEMNAIYSFTPSAEQFGAKQGTPMTKYVRGEATVLKAGADISEIRYSLIHSISMLLGKIDSFSISTHCEPAENGRHFAAETVTEIAGSAPFMHFNERSVEHVNNLRFAN